jgi:hypothetical protein
MTTVPLFEQAVTRLTGDLQEISEKDLDYGTWKGMAEELIRRGWRNHNDMPGMQKDR